MFPGLFPQVLGCGLEGNMSYYDMEIIDGINAYEFLTKVVPEHEIDEIIKFKSRLVKAMERIHGIGIQTKKCNFHLYYKEEIERKLYDCQSNIFFFDLIKHPTVDFGGEFVPSFFHVMKEYEKIFLVISSKNEIRETFSHGNMTLENIMYNRESGKITFIDPYEENIIDSKWCDYSQILQSCNSFYEVYNEGEPQFIPKQLLTFNKIFKEFLNEDSAYNSELVRLFEISQFIRMLPFKMTTDEKGMSFFYKYASKLFYNFQKQWNGR